MLDPAEAAAVAAQFGVADLQVRRDHLLSHLLAALSMQAAEHVVFWGGTALARTHLPDGRLSEDLDLLSTGRRHDAAAALEAVLAVGVRREYGRLTWDPPLRAVHGAQPAVLRSSDGMVVRVQLLDPAGYPPWPTETRSLVQRYADVRPARLAVPTRPAFVAAKTMAWHDRGEPRDLYDLWGLAQIGAIDPDSAAMFARWGPTGKAPRKWMFERPPAAADWQTQLGGQTRIAVDPDTAAKDVWAAWQRTVRSAGR